MKKLLSLFLAFGLLLTGCSSKTSVDNTKKIGVIQLMDHTSLNLIYDSFLDQIKELGYSEDQI
ncbi:MAG: peptide ABC transporter substrate-binding protein, partial [Erysipelotrichaceae bacterium]|nr:peptide ABC transporter substrate-binding protein [Erysipelotrichaceae bacterium]